MPNLCACIQWLHWSDAIGVDLQRRPQNCSASTRTSYHHTAFLFFILFHLFIFTKRISVSCLNFVCTAKNMAEAIGLAASILGILGAAAKVSMTLFSVADALGSAGWEARAIATELSLFSESLRSLRRSIRKYAPKSRIARRAATEMVEASKGLIDDMQEILKTLCLRRNPIRDAADRQ